MANVYATKNGVWSDTTVWNTGALPTTADDVFANNFTVDIDMNVTVLSISNSAASSIVAGGGFTVSGDYILNFANMFSVGGLLAYVGTGTLNLIGNLVRVGSTLTTPGFTISGNGNVNWVGDISYEIANRIGVRKDGNGKLHITGTITGLTGVTNQQGPLIINSGEVEIVGDVIHNGTTGSSVISLTSITCILTITGNCIMNGTASGASVINNNIGGNVNIVGSLISGIYSPAVVSSSATAINIFSGPFICGEYGTMPFQVVRMHYHRTLGSYFEFRDETTDGALAPGAIAPAARLVSPDTVVDAPNPSDVRFGVKYADESQTGTAHIPLKEVVAVGVPVDDGVGEAVLRPQDVWDYLRVNADIPGSFGAWLKNAATIQTTGGQLATLISNNEEE